MKRVLILDANQRSALAVTRSLGRHGAPVICADEYSSSLAGMSRYCESYFTYPSPKKHPLDFIEHIATKAAEQKIDILLPVTELTTSLLLEHHERFGSSTLPFADLKTVLKLADKCQLMQLASKLDVPIPRTWYVYDTSSVPDNLHNLSYPIVLKPGMSWQMTDQEWCRYSVQIIDNPQEAIATLKSDPAFRHPYMIQQCVPGQGRGIFALYNHGQPITFFAHRRIREKPPTGGVSVLSESIEPDPELLGHARTLLDHVNWHGVAMVEFKVDTVTNRPYLMEVNTRFWGSLQLAIDAGVDFPWLLHQMASGASITPIGHYLTGIRSRWLLGDLDNLYLTLRDPSLKRFAKLQAVSNFFTPHPIKTRHEINQWNDLSPFWYELKHYIHDLI